MWSVFVGVPSGEAAGGILSCQNQGKATAITVSLSVSSVLCHVTAGFLGAENFCASLRPWFE